MHYFTEDCQTSYETAIYSISLSSVWKNNLLQLLAIHFLEYG